MYGIDSGLRGARTVLWHCKLRPHTPHFSRSSPRVYLYHEKICKTIVTSYKFPKTSKLQLETRPNNHSRVLSLASDSTRTQSLASAMSASVDGPSPCTWPYTGPTPGQGLPRLGRASDGTLAPQSASPHNPLQRDFEEVHVCVCERELTMRESSLPPCYSTSNPRASG